MEQVATFDTKKNRLVVIGEIEKGCYVKNVSRVKHFLRNYGGYAIQKEVLNELKEYGVKEILIQEDSGKKYKISLNNFIKRGFDIDLGHGKQTVVNEKFYTVEDKSQIYF